MAAGPGPGKAVDRAIGVLVAACASALIVALGARAGASFTTFLRLAYDDHKRGKRRSAGGEEEEGDAYFAYAHGSRSAAAAARARASARDRGGDGGGGRLVCHVGSCHCGGLAFEVEAPEHLVAIEGPSKVVLFCFCAPVYVLFGWPGVWYLCSVWRFLKEDASLLRQQSSTTTPGSSFESMWFEMKFKSGTKPSRGTVPNGVAGVTPNGSASTGCG